VCKVLKALFLNDVGFQYGAGIAHLRQIQSFLKMGWDVSAICWSAGETNKVFPFFFPYMKGRWLGIESLPYLRTDCGISSQRITDTLVHKIRQSNPDVVIVGNIHGARWPLEMLLALKALPHRLVVYMHDCYWFTGRCAYTQGCSMHRTGCNQNCPTWEQYPSLPPDQIFDAWLLRRQLFCGSRGIPIATDSKWLLSELKNSMPSVTKADCVYCGLDESLFSPINKESARRLLGIPLDSFVILGGAVNLTEYRKGGHIFQKLVSMFQAEKDICFLVFGAQSNTLPNVYSTGLIRDYRKMPLVYSAADVFVNTSLEEAFGQTMCEASACGVPVVAFAVGGIPEIARHGINARLVYERSEVALAEEINFFRQEPTERLLYGRAGRELVESEFSLKAQGERWVQYLQSFEDLALDSKRASAPP